MRIITGKHRGRKIEIGPDGGKTIRPTSDFAREAIFNILMHGKLGIDPGKILYNAQGRPTHIVSDPTPIKELM